MIPRRDLLKMAAASAFAYGAAEAEEGKIEQVQPFASSNALALARTMAKAPYQAPHMDLPAPFPSLTYEQYVGIRLKPRGMIWGDENLGFMIEPLHRGFIFSAPMQIHIVENGQARLAAYRAEDFDFGAIAPAESGADLGFSGFRVLMLRDNKLAELAIFQGASFFRARAPGQVMGVQARGLALKTGDPRGEEFPIFKAVWIEKPSVAANSLVIHALLDSESVVGAYRFTLHPAEATLIDTELTLIPRVNVDHVGIAPASATSISSPLDRRRPDDVRPTIAEVNGLEMNTGRNEWIWRPVTNRATLQLSSFMDDNPKGFGFLQRDRDFKSYQDDDLKWQIRPSLWIEPLSDFGAGAVALVEIPADSEINSNCIAYWRPTKGLTAGEETAWAYRQFWCWEPPAHPPNLIVTQSRGGRSPTGAKRRRFIVAFTGEKLADPQNWPDIKPVLSVAPGGIVAMRGYRYDAEKMFRVIFDVDANGENYCEMRLVLESDGKPVSETWLYRWTP